MSKTSGVGLAVQDHSLELVDWLETLPCSRIAAISECFKIVNTNVLEAEQRRQLQAIRQLLDNLEDGGSQVIDV